jgi:Protein of unknown function (DUF4239)
MRLSLWFATIPLWASGLLIVAIPTILAMYICASLRRRVSLEKLSANNEVAGFKFAVLGVVYAVLLGFVVIVVWERFHDAETGVAQQAGALATLYRLSSDLPSQQGTTLGHELNDYVRSAVEDDWPAMAQGRASRISTRNIDRLYVAVGALVTGSGSRIVASDMLTQLDALTQARRTCVVLSEGGVPSVIWAALLLGACATVGFTFFFGTHNVSAQVLMTGLLAFTVFTMLWVVAAMNHPFAGQVTVSVAPLQNLLNDFKTLKAMP